MHIVHTIPEHWNGNGAMLHPIASKR